MGFLFGGIGFLLISLGGRNQDPTSSAWTKVAVLKDSKIAESSGLARSYRTPDAWWTHNDSGDSPRGFLIDRQGNTLATASIPDAKAIDWEDMASFQSDGKPYLLFGDIGGNSRKRKTLELYLVEEPQLSRKPTSQPVDSSTPLDPEIINLSLLSTIILEFPDTITDFESLAIDAESKTGMLIEKSILGGRVYSFPFEIKSGTQKIETKKVGSVSVSFATSCDLSHDGNFLAIASYTSVFLFERTKKEDGSRSTWQESFRKPPRIVALPKAIQVEAICFQSRGKDEPERLLISSERVPTPLFEIPIGAFPPAENPEQP